MKPFRCFLIVGVAQIGLLANATAQTSSTENAPPSSQEISAGIRELTGAPTRVVWLRDGSENPAMWGGGPETLIMGLDTEDGKAERPILPGAGRYSWVYFTPNGEGLVFSEGHADGPGNDMKYVNWDGSGLRTLVEGYWAAAVSGDPETNQVWVYGHPSEGEFKVQRFRLDQPGEGELVWNKNKAIGRFTISQDGKLGGGVYDNSGTGPCGVFSLPNKDFHFVSKGCGQSMLPGTSPYRFFVFDGSHRSGTIFTNPEKPEEMTQQRLDLSQAPGTEGRYEVAFPKWSNHPRYMAVSAPFSAGRNEDRIPFSGGEKLEEKYKRSFDKVKISIARLDEPLTKIEKWVQITYGNRGDYLPEVWVGDPSPIN